MAGQRFRYSRWDGTQKGFDIDAYDVLSEMADDLLYHGDPMAALRRMMQEGFEDRNGDRIRGLNEILDQLRRQRRERLENHDLGGVYDEINQELREIVEAERQALNDRRALADLELGGLVDTDADRRAAELARETTSVKQTQLDLMPDDLAGRVRGLQNYEFESNQAQARFDELVDRLRQQLVQQQFEQMSQSMGNASPEDMARMRDMMAELNEMLEQRARGEEPDFAGFMDRYGDFFPENPRDLDELLEIMARRMAAMSALLNSMTPEQRQQLMDLSAQLLEDLDLNFEASRLAANLQQQFPNAGWDQSYDFSGFDPLGLADASAMMRELGDLDRLESFLGQATSPQQLAEVDLDEVRRLLDRDSAASLERLAQLARMLEEQGLIQTKGGRMELTPRGLRRLGQHALDELFSQLSPDKLGQHTSDRAGFGHERNYATKPYEFGDPFQLNIERTIGNALRRSGRGTPVRLTPDDFEIEQTERQVRSSTVLMLDLSLSMELRANFLPAKKVAMALHSLISTRFPADYLGIVTFSNVARELKASRLPEVSWDFVYGTNMVHGFSLARAMLARQSGTKQILMITDGEPTAHLLPDGSPYFNYPPEPETIRQTLAEVMRCTRAGITINTFMLDPDYGLRGFIERLTAINRGRAFYTSPDNLGQFVLVDFMEHKRKLLGGLR